MPPSLKGIVGSLSKIYRRFFSVQEIEQSLSLKLIYASLLLTQLAIFSDWIGRIGITKEAFVNNTYQCWPYFQNCGELYFLSALPYGYSQTTLYMAFFGLMLLGGYSALKNRWELAHGAFLVLFIWEAFVITVLSPDFSGNFDYYHLVLGFVFLFLPLKLLFLKISFVLMYFLSSTIKFDETWILGTYFSALQTGMPIFPDSTIPLWSNAVIFMQVIGAWFLFSKNKILQRTALLYFVAFHLYSGILVEYRYPLTVLPPLLILFGPLYMHTKIPRSWKVVPGMLLVGIMFVLQLASAFIPGDERRTLEGNNYGLYMFEANHQCVSEAWITRENGETQYVKDEVTLARNRCNPYRYWFWINQVCQRDKSVTDVYWRFDHSINGGPFYRMVDERDACSLQYEPFTHNEWIKTLEEGAKEVGLPVKNIYR